ncbi:unnamed protein product [Brachionus calyciflorus]|uniref:Uncharacterized protein n=1 Tax=Brachionus calyciflorus TaxID=104777 RepID=A0A813M5Z9_9BILA|nr:unnamed protein product [Brachionus calyciflorus]
MATSTINVGVVGYSATKFDKLKGANLVKKAFDELEKQFGSNIAIVSGYTNIGIPALAYQEAAKRGWKTVGIACKRAKNYDCFQCEEVVIVGNKWGDESETFIDYISVLIKIGGGRQSIKELEMAKFKNKIIFEYKLEGSYPYKQN